MWASSTCWTAAVSVGPAATAVAEGQAAALSGGSALDLTAGGEGASVFFAFARPLNEPVARYGPFVMNTKGGDLRRHPTTSRKGGSRPRGLPCGPLLAAGRKVH